MCVHVCACACVSVCTWLKLTSLAHPMHAQRLQRLHVHPSPHSTAHTAPAPAPYRDKLAICEQICGAMCELVTEGVLHRDLAARNILVQSLEPVHIKVGRQARLM